MMLGGMLPYLAMAQLFATQTHGENPAIKVIVTDKGLQYAKEMGATWLLDNVGSVSLPDVEGKVSLSFLGDVDYSLISMRVTQFDLPEPTVNFYEDISGFKAYISGVHVTVSGLWFTSYGIIEDDGDFDLEVLDVEVEVFLSVGMDAGGHLRVQCAACGAAVGSVSMHFYGGGSWIFQPFVNKYTDLIISTIEEKICPELRQSLDRLQYQLLAMGVTFQVNKLLAVDVPLTSTPVISSSSLTLSLKGLFHMLDSQETPPFEAQPLWLAEEPGHMLSLGLSQYTINSAAYAYFKSKNLTALITDDMIPPASPFRLNTNSLGRFVPQLSKMYPDMEMQLQVNASEAPEVHFKPGAVKTNLLGAIQAFAIQAHGTLIPLFKLNVESTFTGKFHMATGKLMGSVAMNNFTLTLAASEVGPFKTSALETIIMLGIKLSGLSAVNAKLAKGIDLPTMQHVQLANLVLKVEEGFISVLSDANIWLMGDSYDGTPWIF